ncbi:MAG: carbohydrate-binding protein [Bacteroidaceae bacterium]|nr:carbohydrate-binding protein [Bacteroidaceae bacterium]
MKRFLLVASILLSHSFAMQAQVETPTMGWSSWNTFAVNISEDIIKGQADAMVSQGLKDVGYQYINIDDGFQYGRTSDGKVRIHPTRFPNGLKVVSDYIHSKGLKAGIYSDAGDCTCGSLNNGDTQNTNVGFYGYEQVDADYYFNELEFDFIKVDYCGGNHAGLNEQEQYTAIHNAIVNTGKDVRYNLCRWAYPGTWCHDISTSWRTTGDIYDGWESVKGIINENLYLSAYCYDGCYNDMDMLEVGRSMSEEEDKTHFGMWCIMSSPLLIGCNMATLRERPLALLKNEELIALNQDPLGLQAYVVQHIGETYVLAKDILSLHGKTRAVALYNPSDREEEMCISFSEVDLGGQVMVRDLFEHEDMGTMEGALTVVVPPHGTRIYKLQAETRLERYIYEAETAFLHDYQEIYNNQAVGSAIYEKNSSASGGTFVSWLGGKRSNSLLWKDVYVIEEADYTVHICGASGESRSLAVVLNGEKVGNVSMMTNNWNTFKEYTKTLHLNAGSNSIELYNESGWMPNIDYMSIEKAGENTIMTRRLEETVKQLEVMARNMLLPDKLRQNIETLLARATSGNLTNNQIKSLLTQTQNMQNTIKDIMPLCEEYHFWRSYADKNVAVSLESTPLETLLSRIESSRKAFSNATAETAVTNALKTLKNAVTTYLKADGAAPREGEYLDMTLFIANYDFSTKDGWEGEPTYRNGCGEEYNKAFDLYQTLTDMKPGVYVVKCNALFRPKGNDGGAAYRAGTENIKAYLYVNNKQVKVKSLYSEDWPDASSFGSVDNQNGYPHSMRAAGIRFAEGCYQNSIKYTLSQTGTLRFGLKCSSYTGAQWCCFDNFALYYQALPDFYDGINSLKADPSPSRGETYDLQGRKVPNDKKTKGIVISEGKKVLR